MDVKCELVLTILLLYGGNQNEIFPLLLSITRGVWFISTTVSKFIHFYIRLVYIFTFVVSLHVVVFNLDLLKNILMVRKWER